MTYVCVCVGGVGGVLSMFPLLFTQYTTKFHQHDAVIVNTSEYHVSLTL